MFVFISEIYGLRRKSAANVTTQITVNAKIHGFREFCEGHGDCPAAQSHVTQPLRTPRSVLSRILVNEDPIELDLDLGLI